MAGCPAEVLLVRGSQEAMDEGVHCFYDVVSSAGCQLAQGIGVQPLEIVQQLIAVLALEVP